MRERRYLPTSLKWLILNITIYVECDEILELWAFFQDIHFPNIILYHYCKTLFIREDFIFA